jgi:hypothetical protein
MEGQLGGVGLHDGNASQPEANLDIARSVLIAETVQQPSNKFICNRSQ